MNFETGVRVGLGLWLAQRRGAVRAAERPSGSWPLSERGDGIVCPLRGKAAMFQELGIEVNICGTGHGLSEK